MKLTKESNKLMSFFIKHNCLIPIKQTKKTDNILKNLYSTIKDGVSYVQNEKDKLQSKFYKLKITSVTNISQIPRPITFPPNSFPDKIRKHIDDYGLTVLTYSFKLYNREINIIFLTEDEDPDSIVLIYNKYVDYILVWLYIVNIYSSKGCVDELKIYIYHTSLLKLLPSTNIEILNSSHVNTAFTRTCPKKSEIVVFRKEEWFKAFIHETFHNFGLDFSDMNQSQCNSKILSIFPVNSEVNLYESYTEFWARIINALMCSYINMTDKNNIEEFLTNAEFFINFERIFSFFQMIKVLNFMDISYTDMYKKDPNSNNIRKLMFKEHTSVLSYYIITLILMNSYQDILSWCNESNDNLLQFKKTSRNLESFCKLIEKKYKIRTLLDGIKCSEELFINVEKRLKKQKSLLYLMKSLRMTICELG
jgi:hypothetical protein